MARSQIYLEYPSATSIPISEQEIRLPMATDYELTLSDYLSIMRRRAAYLIGTFVAVLLIVIEVAFYIPPTYRSTGTIMVESPLVSDNTSAGAIRNDLDERIDVIKQRVMTRDNLLQIISKYSLYKEIIGSITTTELVEKMRAHVFIESISSNTSKQGQPTIAFTISFEDHNAEVALQVANDFVTRFLQLNLRESMRAGNEKDLYEVERDIRTTNEELRSFGAELSGAKYGATGEGSPSETLPTSETSPTSQTLPMLKAEYSRLSTVYTESHPDVMALKRKIDALEQASKTDALEQTSKTSGSKTIPALNFSSAAYLARVKVNAANAKLNSLMQQKKMLQDKIAKNEHTVTQNLEGGNKSERFSLLEPPILPEKPFKPNRMKIIAMGFFFAIASSGGGVMALESIDKRIRGTEALAHVLGYRPLVVIPYLPIQEEGVRRKRMRKRALIAAVITLIAVMVALHFLYMPLNILFIKFLAGLA
jgi:succinoglycan biosynthesis transport protein ExoP